MSPNPEASWRESVVAAGVLVVLGLLVRWLLDPLLGERVVFVTMFPSVAAAAWFGGASGGIAGDDSGRARDGVSFHPA